MNTINDKEFMENFKQELLDYRDYDITSLDLTGHDKPRNILALFKLIHQINSRRLLELIYSIEYALENKYYYVAPILIRGMIESIAFIGDATKKVSRWNNGLSETDDVGLQLLKLLSGTKDNLLKEQVPGLEDATNILTLLKNTDKLLLKITDGVFGVGKKSIYKLYSSLSEYSHPNFQSNSSQLLANKKNFVFKKPKDSSQKQLMELNFSITVMYGFTIMRNGHAKIDELVLQH